jgi:ribosomal protein S18 acetylase RimI-like enzyme
MRYFDLRLVHSRQLEQLFEEEARCWLEELHWDYRPSIQLIRKFIDARSLGGAAALENGAAAGYGFYVIEETKGLLGGMFVSARYAQEGVCQRLLAEMLAPLRALPHLNRVEAQLIPFGTSFEPALLANGFRLYPRQFMLLPLSRAPMAAAPLSPGLRLERWDDRYFEGCARLIQLAYANHVDSEINDQYRTEEGALKFLKNIIILPGCGQFLPEASFVVRPVASDRLIGVVLNSAVSAGAAHTTQVCVMPGYQGHGLGLRLLEASIQTLKSRRFHVLTLTVTAQNAKAVRLYDKLGFETVKTFAAGVWQV